MGLFRKAVSTLASGLRLTDPALVRWLGVEPAHSGERVTVETALTLDAVWACVRLVSQTIATLPVMLYERGDASGESRVASEHPLYRVIHDRPNQDMTAVEFWTAMLACKLLWGNAYAAITKRADGSMISLDPMLPQLVQVDRQTDGSRTFTYTLHGFTTVYQEEDILHLKGFSLDGLTGMSAIAWGRHSLGAALGAERVSGATFKNGMRPSGVLTAPAYLNADQRPQAKKYLEEFQGAANTGKVPLLEGGWKFEALTLTPADAELLATRGFNIETICRWFGVPPTLIGHTEKATTWGTGLEQINLGFLTYTLRSHLKEIEQALAMRCLRPGEAGSFYAEFNVEGLLRADSKGRADYYRVMVSSGLMTPNEIRALENLPPREGGNDLMMQGAMMPIAQLGADPEGGGAPTGELPFYRDPVDPLDNEWKSFDPLKHPRDARGRFSGAGGSGRAAKRLARRALADRMLLDVLDLGEVPGAKYSSAAGIDVDGWRFGLDAQFVRHIHDRHGGASERQPIVAGDYENLPRVLRAGTITRGGKTKHQQMQTVIVRRTVKGRSYRAVLAVRPRRRTLTLHTFSKDG